MVWSVSCFLLAFIALGVFTLTEWRAFELIGVGLGGIAAGLALSLSILQWRKLPEYNVFAAWFRRGRY